MRKRGGEKRELSNYVRDVAFDLRSGIDDVLDSTY